jgi:hypothetical protein
MLHEDDVLKSISVHQNFVQISSRKIVQIIKQSLIHESLPGGRPISQPERQDTVLICPEARSKREIFISLSIRIRLNDDDDEILLYSRSYIRLASLKRASRPLPQGTALERQPTETASGLEYTDSELTTTRLSISIPLPRCSAL